jgi:hypothetical protein
MTASAVKPLKRNEKTTALQTHHEVQVNVVDAKGLQRAGNALFDALVPWVVELGGDPDLLAGNTRVLDTLANLLLVAVGKSCIDVAVAGLERSLDGFANFTRLRLPSSEADRGDLCAGVELQAVSVSPVM